MKILNIHGYGGTPENGFYHALREYGVSEIISPGFDYDRQSPGAVWIQLNALFDQEQPDAVTGSSLGGYYAALICAVKGTRALLVNPCLIPQLTLPRLGFRERSFIREYMQLGAHLGVLKNAYAILGGQDDVVDYHDFTRFLLPEGHCIIVPGGGHRGSSLPLTDLLRSYGDTFFG